jgi:hypothetical protein
MHGAESRSRRELAWAHSKSHKGILTHTPLGDTTKRGGRRRRHNSHSHGASTPLGAVRPHPRVELTTDGTARWWVELTIGSRVGAIRWGVEQTVESTIRWRVEETIRRAIRRRIQKAVRCEAGKRDGGARLVPVRNNRCVSALDGSEHVDSNVWCDEHVAQQCVV